MHSLDGAPTVAFPGNGTITPAEIIENGSPIVVIERSLRPEFCGPGQFRGGSGQVIRLTAVGQSVKMTIRPDKMRFPAPGIAGGLPGAPGELLLDGQPMALEPFQLIPGREVTLKLPGGGGYGDPAARDRRALLNDIGQGLVTPEAARVHYGHQEAGGSWSIGCYRRSTTSPITRSKKAGIAISRTSTSSSTAACRSGPT